MTTVLTEGFRPGEYLVSQAEGYRSREQVTLLSGQVVTPGTVLARVDHAGASAAAVAGNTGDGTIGAVTLAAGAASGVYTVSATASTKFRVEDPSGVLIGTATVGTQFAKSGLTFTVAAGGTAFAVGDAFTITVAAGSGKYVALDLAGSDGRQHAVAVAYGDGDATGGDRRLTVTARDAEVNANSLTWPTGITAPQLDAAVAELAVFGIIVRA